MIDKNVQNVIPNVDSKKKEERNVPDLRFSNNVKWYKIKLGEILKIKSGMDQKKVECENGIYNIYGTGGIIGKTNIPLYSKKSVGIGRKGTIDKPFYFDEPFWTVDTLFYSEIKSHSPKFLYYLFQTINWKYYNQSTGVPSLTSSVIENIAVYVPNSDDEEIKIADFLDLVEKRITTQKKIISNLKSLINSIKNTEFYYIKGFKEKLENILIELNEKTIINNQYDVLSSTVKGIFKQSDYFDRTVARENTIGYKIVKRGNIVVSPQNLWMGNISYNDKFDMGIVSPSYKIFNISSNYNERYIFEMLTTKKSLYLFKTVSEQGASVVRRNLNYEAFMQLTFNVPSLNEQNNFIEKLSLLQSKLSLENKILSLLEQQKQYLLDKLFI